MNHLAIIGASDHGKVVAEVAVAIGWSQVDFYDDDHSNKAFLCDYPVRGDFNDLIAQSDKYSGFHVAVGCNRTRILLLKKLINLGLECPNIIFPSAFISPSSRFGVGNFVMANVVVKASTAIGDGVVLNTACTVAHDCMIGSGAQISPGAHLAGHVSVGSCAWIGIGACVIQGIKIGDNSIIGAGSAVIRNVPSNVTSVGVPSKNLE